MVSLLVVQIIKYRFGAPVVAMESRIRVQSRNPVKYVIHEPVLAKDTARIGNKLGSYTSTLEWSQEQP